MSQRLDYVKASPGGFKAMLGLEAHVKGALDKMLLHLVKVRASQINGCAYCIDMHWREAKADGETDPRLYMLNAWHESTLYTEKERAALAWTEALTLISTSRAPDSLFAIVRAQFSDKELADLSWAIAAINAWNRISIGFGVAPKA